jgi:hypothetical protein
MKRLYFISLIITCFAYLTGEAQDQILYKTIDTTQLYLTVYQSAINEPTKQSPALVFFFGGGWNITILTEVISWGSTTLTATGLGSYIAESTAAGDFPRVALGMAMMSAFVLVMNHLVWRPLYNLSQSRYRLD